MKIVLLGRYNPSEKLTGPEKFAKRLYQNFIKQNVDCEFIEYFFDGKKHSIIKKLFGKEKLRYNGSEILRLGIVPLFFRLIKLKPQLIHLVTYERFQIVAFIYSLFFKTWILFSVHGIVNYENDTLAERNVSLILKMKDKLFENIFIKFADIVHIGSKCYKTILVDFYSIEQSKVIVIPFGVDNDMLNQKKQDINLSEAKLKIVFIGDSIRVEKGMNFLLSLYDNLKEHFEVYIIGEIFNCDTSSYNGFYFVAKMQHEEYRLFLRDKDIILSCSFYDTFNIAVFEALATGLYPVVTSETGISELFEENSIGRIFSYGNKEKLVEILYGLNENRKLIDTMNSQTFVQQYTWDKICELYINLYNRIIS